MGCAFLFRNNLMEDFVNIQSLLAAASFTGIGFAIVWVLFWTALVPEIFPGWTWEGHEALIVPVFLTGALVGPLAVAFSRTNNSSRRRYR